MLSTRMNLAKKLIAKGVKKGDHPYVTEYYDRIAAAEEESKNKRKQITDKRKVKN